MAASADRIMELLGNGLSNEVVATAVGVHPSYISQLMADENFAAQVVAKRTTTLAAATTRDRSWDSIEDKMLVKLDEMVSNDMIYKPMELVRALSVVNAAKRRGSTTQDNMAVNQQVVVLNMPTQVIHSFTKSRTGEVVEVDGQTLVTMPAAALMSQLAKKHEGRADYEQVRRYLPQDTEVKEGSG